METLKIKTEYVTADGVRHDTEMEATLHQNARDAVDQFVGEFGNVIQAFASSKVKNATTLQKFLFDWEYHKLLIEAADASPVHKFIVDGD